MVSVMRTALITVCALAASARAQVPWSIVSGNSGEGLGFAVCSAGDVDHDGVPDWAAGAPYPGTSSSPGHVEIHSGSTGALLRTYTGLTPSGYFGRSVANAGDVDGDGWPDLAVGATIAGSSSSPPGSVWVYSGRDGSLLHMFQETPGQTFGLAVAGIGDVNGDGRPDVAVGEPGDASLGFFTGKVYVYSGLDGSLLSTVSGTAAGEELGTSIVGGRDLDHDGRADFVVGSPGGSGSLGLVRAYSGASGAVLFTTIGTMNGQSFGRSVDFCGDVDHDGTEDLVVGSYSGSCTIVSGANGSILVAITGSHADGFGFAVCGPGDVDGDGTPDVVSGSPWSNLGSFTSGAVGFFSGVQGASIATVSLPGPGQPTLGYSLAAIGDVNGDGVGDIVAGAPGQSVVRVIVGGCPPPHAYCTAKTNSHGCVPHIGFSGTGSLSSSGFVVSASNVLSHAPGMLFWGTTPASIPFNGGTLCATGSPIVRTPIQNSGGASAASDCSGTYAFAFTPAYMASKGLVSGSHVFAQFYSRDVGFQAPQNVGLTDAIEFVVCP